MIADPHRPNAMGVEGTVAIANQMTRRFIPGKSISHLPSDPLGSRIGSDANHSCWRGESKEPPLARACFCARACLRPSPDPRCA